MAEKLISALVVMLLGACAMASRQTTLDGFCDNARPILVSKTDAMTLATAKAIRTHNETGAALCGWGKK